MTAKELFDGYCKILNRHELVADRAINITDKDDILKYMLMCVREINKLAEAAMMTKGNGATLWSEFEKQCGFNGGGQ